MSFNLIDLLKGFITPDLISKAGSFLNESDSGISSAVSGILPALVGGIANHASQSESNATGLLDSAKSIFSSGLLNNTSSLFGNADLLSKGASLINTIFGGKSSSIIDTISNFAGVKSSTSSSLMSMIAPLALGLLGKKSSEDNLTGSSFANLLSGQSGFIKNALPSGLSGIGSLLGIGSLASAASNITESVKETAHTYTQAAGDSIEEASSTGVKWLWPLLLVAAIGLGLWYFNQKGCGKSEAVATTEHDHTAGTDSSSTVSAAVSSIAGALDTLTGNFIYDVGAEKEIKLADGTALKVGENSTEAKLFNFLNDANVTVDTADKSKGWIVLDRVYFETGKDVLTAASDAQLKNIAAILKNFANAQTKLGGYTDNTGSQSINQPLSAKRAKIVADKIIANGVTAANIASEGYGSDHPVCAANDTPECKAQNRRVDIRVTKK